MSILEDMFKNIHLQHEAERTVVILGGNWLWGCGGGEELRMFVVFSLVLGKISYILFRAKQCLENALI